MRAPRLAAAAAAAALLAEVALAQWSGATVTFFTEHTCTTHVAAVPVSTVLVGPCMSAFNGNGAGLTAEGGLFLYSGLGEGYPACTGLCFATVQLSAICTELTDLSGDPLLPRIWTTGTLFASPGAPLVSAYTVAAFSAPTCSSSNVAVPVHGFAVAIGSAGCVATPWSWPNFLNVAAKATATGITISLVSFSDTSCTSTPVAFYTVPNASIGVGNGTCIPSSGGWYSIAVGQAAAFHRPKSGACAAAAAASLIVLLAVTAGALVAGAH